MSYVFLGLFVFGLAFVILSFLLGFAAAELHLPGLGHEAHLPPNGHNLTHVDSSSPHETSPLNVSTFMAFITWFGGIGYILTRWGELSSLAVLTIAILGGMVGASSVFLLLDRVILPGQTPVLRAGDYRLEGTLARVSIPMSGSRIGEIIFTQHGTTRSEGARSEDGSPIPRGEQVVILRYERGIAYVRPLAKLLEEHDLGVQDLKGIGAGGLQSQPEGKDKP